MGETGFTELHHSGYQKSGDNKENNVMEPLCSIRRSLMKQPKDFLVDMSAGTSRKGFKRFYSSVTIFNPVGQNFKGKGLCLKK